MVDIVTDIDDIVVDIQDVHNKGTADHRGYIVYNNQFDHKLSFCNKSKYGRGGQLSRRSQYGHRGYILTLKVILSATVN